MDLHPLKLISYTPWDIRSPSKDDFRMERHDLNIRVKITNCVCKVLNKVAYYLKKILVYLEVYLSLF